ncbi:nucleotidyl transferase AbiEii/AbiGii toxin family protein [Polynucleobacter sp. QLW-P1DATA-2]|uniref:nucleotidyl transferase AbiEii/AbiGii toxin family protein n=1 Tax=Polynucleobacter sp. QLW-P1DATA-2 TaxID=1743167 RepID=UPI0009F1CE50|nr:nucleotidyl transferase AbiEii/AbiGii toxin family protein [Polynucleobacter sp. QLW-P1DATA-2]
MMRQEDFKLYVEKAMASSEMAAMRPVVEKELLHYEIFNALDGEGLLKNLVFQGGTSLRLCRGSERFSEDLDFVGGTEFTSESMEKIKDCIVKHIGERFGLRVTVKEPKPVNDDALVNVNKWMISIETNPGSPDIPRQKNKN